MILAATVAATLAWTPLPAAALPRGEVAAARVGGSIYVAGGFNPGGRTSASVERYEIRRRRWSRGPDFPGPARNHMTGVASCGRPAMAWVVPRFETGYSRSRAEGFRACRRLLRSSFWTYRPADE